MIVFGFFIDFKSLSESKRLQDNYQYLKALVLPLWKNYFSSGFHYFWDKIVIEYIYKDLFLGFIWPKIKLKSI